MEILSLDSESEANLFLELLKQKSDLLDTWTHIGGMTLKGGSRTEWYWDNLGTRIHYPIKWVIGEPSNDLNEEFCLADKKYSENNFF